MCYFIYQAVVIILIGIHSARKDRNCQLKKSSRKISSECFSEPECGENCSVQNGSICSFEQELECQVVREEKCQVKQEEKCNTVQERQCNTVQETKCQTGVKLN